MTQSDKRYVFELMREDLTRILEAGIAVMFAGYATQLPLRDSAYLRTADEMLASLRDTERIDAKIAETWSLKTPGHKRRRLYQRLSEILNDPDLLAFLAELERQNVFGQIVAEYMRRIELERN